MKNIRTKIKEGYIDDYIKPTIKGPLSYEDLYSLVINHSDKYPKTKDKIIGLAQYMYSYGYKDDDIRTKDDAIWSALEAYEMMTGIFIDPTHDEYDEIRSSIIGDGRGRLKTESLTEARSKKSIPLGEVNGIPIFWDEENGVAYIFTRSMNRGKMEFPSYEEAAAYLND